MLASRRDLYAAERDSRAQDAVEREKDRALERERLEVFKLSLQAAIGGIAGRSAIASSPKRPKLGPSHSRSNSDRDKNDSESDRVDLAYSEQ